MQELIKDLHLEIEVARFEELGPEWQTDKIALANRVIPYSRLYLPVEGEGVLIHHGREYHLFPGSMFLLPAYTNMLVSCPKRLVKYWCHFNAYVSNSNLDIFSLYEPVYTVELGKNADLVKNLFIKLVELHKNPRANLLPVDLFESKSALGFLISRFLRTIEDDIVGKPINALIKFADLLAYIEKNISTKITLAALSKIVNLNPNYLSNLFAKKIGLPPLAYCNQRRIQLAMDILSSTDLNVSEVADRVGVEDVSNFSKMFKRLTSFSPSEYRKLRCKHEKTKSSYIGSNVNR